MYSEQVQRELIERLRKRAECFDYDARPDIATDYEMAAAVIEDLKEKYDNSRESTKWLMEQVAKVVRCKDCKKYREKFFPNGESYGWYCSETHYGRNPDDFCNYAERRAPSNEQ